MKAIYVVSYTVDEHKDDERIVFPSAITKSEYITKKIRDEGIDIQIVSGNRTKKKTGKVSQKMGINQFGVPFVLGKTFGASSRIGIILQKLNSFFWLVQYLLKNIKPDTKLILYHSPSNILPVLLAHYIKKCELVLEVEEIYSSFPGYGRIRRLLEYRIFRAADKYIFASELLEKKINTGTKIYCLSYGSYFTRPRVKRENKDKIHLVYAGTFDPRKKGVYNAIASAEFLDENYVMHIMGFGSNRDVENVLKQIELVRKKTKCEIQYAGCLSGEVYDRALEICDIALSTQTSEGIYNSTSFPSKILVYLAHGLKVITIRIPVLENSAIDKYLNYYDEDTPEAIANAIKISSNGISNGYEIVDLLDKSFSKDIFRLLHE